MTCTWHAPVDMFPVHQRTSSAGTPGFVDTMQNSRERCRFGWHMVAPNETSPSFHSCSSFSVAKAWERDTVLQESSSRHGLGGQFLMEDSRCNEPVGGSTKIQRKPCRCQCYCSWPDLRRQEGKGFETQRRTRMISWAWINTENQHIVTFTSYYQMYSYAFLLPANGFRLWKVSRQADGLPAFWRNSSSISRLMCFMLIFHTLKAWGFDFADMPLAKPRPRVCALGQSDQIGPCHYAILCGNSTCFSIQDKWWEESHRLAPRVSEFSPRALARHAATDIVILRTPPRERMRS